MTVAPQKLGFAALVLALLASASPALAFQVGGQDGGQVGGIGETFARGVELLRRGNDAEALQALQKVLAAEPTQEQAYELWKSTDHQVWLDLLTKGGEFELVARHLMGLVSSARAERRDDPEAIRALIRELSTDDPLARRAAIRKLASEHGEYAVPYLLGSLVHPSDEERRVSAMQALTQMGGDVVLPLIEALESPDPLLRRNVALTLGYLGDRRAAPMLAWIARSDEADDGGGARAAAQEALAKTGGTRDPLRAFLQAGEDYHLRKDNVLAPHQYSDVAWKWTQHGLVSTPISRDLYPDELAWKCFQRALRVDPGSTEALAGLARAAASEVASAEALRAAGQDVGELERQLETDSLAVQIVGGPAADAALQQSIEQADAATAAALASSIETAPGEPVAGLESGLRSGDAALRSHAAVALGKLALAGQRPAGPDVIAALAETAGREIVRIAFVIDPDEDRARALAAALESRGLAVNHADRGARGLALLHRMPGVDVVLVADKLPDLTTHQVIADVREDPRLEGMPILVVSSEAESAQELYGELTQGVVAGAGDVDAITEAMSEELSGDRKRADEMSAQAVELLAGLATKGQDVRLAVPALAATIARRPDAVAIPAARALGLAGGASEGPGLLALLANEQRSDEARAAAGHGLAGIFARSGGPAPADAKSVLVNVLHSAAALPVRIAAAHALGRLKLSPPERAEILHNLRVQPPQTPSGPSGAEEADEVEAAADEEDAEG